MNDQMGNDPQQRRAVPAARPRQLAQGASHESAAAVIVGAGINGLCIADALMDRGWRVTVADRGPIPNPLSASYDRHRLIRAHYADGEVYCRRIGDAFAAWETLWTRIGAQHYRQTGMLALCSTRGDWTDRARATFDRLAIPYIRLSPAELARRYPVFKTSDAAYGLMTESGGVLFADAILTGLAASLRARGATLVERFDAATLEVSAARARAKDGRKLEADVLIAAAGTGTGRLVGEHLPDPFTPMRSTVLYVEPPTSWLPHLHGLPCWLSLGGDSDLWGVPPVAGIPMKIGCGVNTRSGNPDERRVSAGEIETILAVYRRRLPDFGAARAVQAIANFWTLAPGGGFVFRRIERCYVVLACSGHGFKFGPLTGREVAQAITTGRLLQQATGSRDLPPNNMGPRAPQASANRIMLEVKKEPSSCLIRTPTPC